MNEKHPDDRGREITALLRRRRAGDEQARDELMLAAYDELRRIAARLLAGERPGHTLQPTALVNEACMKLDGAKVNWRDRVHFKAVAARCMRRILVDDARIRRRDQRQTGRVPLEGLADVVLAPAPDLLALDMALSRLAALRPRMVEIVEMRFFGGLNYGEIAEVLGISSNTVMRDWNFARAWLLREMKGRLPEEDTPEVTA